MMKESAESIHRLPLVDPGEGPHQLPIAHHGADLLVVDQPAPKLLAQSLEGRLSDPGHVRAGLVESADELHLVSGKAGLDEDYVHFGTLPLEGC